MRTLAHHGQFLQARGRAEWPGWDGHACFGFRHALYQDLLYQRIPAGRQTRWHARIGQRLAQGFGAQAGDLAGALALHCVRGRLLPQAVQYLRQAGEKAMTRSAHREAAGYFEQALSALPQLPETQDTREQAIDLRLALLGALAVERLRAYTGASARLRPSQRPRRPASAGQVSLLLAEHFRFMGAYDQAIAAAQRALAPATASGDVVLHALANRELGAIYQAQGDYRRAIDCLMQTVVSLDGAQRRERFGRVILPPVLCRAFLAWCYAELGCLPRRALGDEGFEIAEAVAHRASRMYASLGVGLLSLRQGDLPRALPSSNGPRDLCQDTDLPVFSPGWRRPWVRRIASSGASTTPCSSSPWRWNRPLRRQRRAFTRPVLCPSARRRCWPGVWRRRTRSPSAR